MKHFGIWILFGIYRLRDRFVCFIIIPSCVLSWILLCTCIYIPTTTAFPPILKTTRTHNLKNPINPYKRTRPTDNYLPYQIK